MPATNQYPGYLLVANPNNPRDSMSRSVILLTEHEGSRAIGIQLNKPLANMTLAEVAINAGMEYQNSSREALHFGGNFATNKVNIIHSSDWYSSGTVKLTKDISVTHDISILSAISQRQGPRHYRACSGCWVWENYSLDYQLDSFHPMEHHRWEVAPAIVNTIFDLSGLDQWRKAIEDAANYSTAQWF